MNKIIIFFLCLITFSTVFPVYRYIPGIITICTIIVFILNLLQSFLGNIIVFKIERPLIIFLIFLIYTLLNWMFTGYSDRGGLEISRFFLNLTLLLVFISNIKSAKQLNIVTVSWVIGVVATTILGIIEGFKGVYIEKMKEQYDFIYDYQLRFIPYDFEPNYLQINLAIPLMLAFYYFKNAKNLNIVILFYVFFLIIVLEYILTASKFGFLTILFLAPFYFYKTFKKKRLRYIAVISLFFFFLYGMVGSFDFSILDYNFERYSTLLSNDDRVVFSNRNVLFEKAIQIFLDNPIFGFGLGAVTELMTYIYGKGSGTTHNTFLHIMAELGIIGLILYLLLILSLLRIRSFKNLNPYQMGVIITFLPMMNVTAINSNVFWMGLTLAYVSTKVFNKDISVLK